MNAPTTITPNLPVLIDALPSDTARAAQTAFTLERRVAFIDALAQRGDVRAAARRAGVSHQTVYRARRACARFRRCWDAARLAARPQVEDVLGCRAVDGVEEPVFYHGDEIARRRRYDSRLLLAHLARLDKLAEDAGAAALAEDFDATLDAYGAGEDLPEAPPTDGACAAPPEGGEAERHGEADRNEEGETGPEDPSSGECNTRSMSPLDEDEEVYVEAAFWREDAAMRPDVCQGSWPFRVEDMLRARPDHAPCVPYMASTEQGEGSEQDLRDLLYAQVCAFEEGRPEWWLLGADGRRDDALIADWYGPEGAPEGAGG
ncbi:hypothetical protein [Pseudoblastomonas halimionae]|uniref:Uncharacterized protein n=1 Tax=Alteriqipengyuania halimionae TaxID=1926630 RepID=A0A6I4U1P6_9SPHN|nr:hypothetical protein [Alteriqipengyuania halimionae]MXP09828.1 hypothetical protein [Alteriqipengyuania halimionae]